MTTDSPPTILLLGATGQVGHELRNALAPLGRIRAPDREALDLADPEALREAVRDESPSFVVNAAGYTAVDEAEGEQTQAEALNTHAPKALAEAAKEVDGWLVHYSSDYVFDGTKTTPYREEDRPNPINTYGRTKWQGDRAIRAVGGPHLILRTSWVYSDRRSNFLRTILRLADEQDRIPVVDDQIGTPTWAGWVAEATAALLRRLTEMEEPTDHGGLYHLAAGGQTSWYGFAKAILARFGRDDVTVEPVPTDAYPTVAPRPSYSALASDRVRSTFDLSIPTWSEQLAALHGRMGSRKRRQPTEDAA